jgi:hypothetical protein
MPSANKKSNVSKLEPVKKTSVLEISAIGKPIGGTPLPPVKSSPHSLSSEQLEHSASAILSDGLSVVVQFVSAVSLVDPQEQNFEQVICVELCKLFGVARAQIFSVDKARNEIQYKPKNKEKVLKFGLNEG